jgi:hypothetical protein
MNQLDRKAWLIGELLSGRYRSSDEAVKALREVFSAFQAIPAGLRDQPTHICRDLAQGRISELESVRKLVDFVETISDEI